MKCRYFGVGRCSRENLESKVCVETGGLECGNGAGCFCELQRQDDAEDKMQVFTCLECGWSVLTSAEAFEIICGCGGKMEHRGVV